MAHSLFLSVLFSSTEGFENSTDKNFELHNVLSFFFFFFFASFPLISFYPEGAFVASY
jgi:hypothetical protein